MGNRAARDSCVAVEQGNSYDVFELDAASNNSVEDIRSLIDKVSLGTPAAKVHILDEVHMLSAGASAALLRCSKNRPTRLPYLHNRSAEAERHHSVSNSASPISPSSQRHPR